MDHSPAEEEFTTWLKGVIESGEQPRALPPGRKPVKNLKIDGGINRGTRVVYIDFSTNVSQIRFTQGQARDLGRILMHLADQLDE